MSNFWQLGLLFVLMICSQLMSYFCLEMLSIIIFYSYFSFMMMMIHLIRYILFIKWQGLLCVRRKLKLSLSYWYMTILQIRWIFVPRNHHLLEVVVYCRLQAIIWSSLYISHCLIINIYFCQFRWVFCVGVTREIAYKCVAGRERFTYSPFILGIKLVIPLTFFRSALG